MPTKEKPKSSQIGKMSEQRFYCFAFSFISYFALKFFDSEIAGTVSSVCGYLSLYWFFDTLLTPDEPKQPFSESTSLTQRLREGAIILVVIVGGIVGLCYIQKYLASFLFSHPKRHYTFDETIKGIYRYALGIIVTWILIPALLRITWVYRVHHSRATRPHAGIA